MKKFGLPEFAAGEVAEVAEAEVVGVVVGFVVVRAQCVYFYRQKLL